MFPVMGAVVSAFTEPMLVMEYMEYGSLYDLLRNETFSASGEIIIQVGGVLCVVLGT
jgi:hypothetical protein